MSRYGNDFFTISKTMILRKDYFHADFKKDIFYWQLFSQAYYVLNGKNMS